MKKMEELELLFNQALADFDLAVEQFEKAQKGNLSAAIRFRKATVRIGKTFKLMRTVSVQVHGI